MRGRAVNDKAIFAFLAHDTDSEFGNGEGVFVEAVIAAPLLPRNHEALLAQPRDFFGDNLGVGFGAFVVVHRKALEL